MPRDRRDDRYYDDERDDDRRRYRDDDDGYDDRPPRRRDDRDDDGYDDRPRRGAEPPTNGPALTSLVLGVVSFVGGLTAIPGLIFGFIGLSKAKQLGGAGKGMAITGTALSGVGIVVLGLTIWLASGLFKPRDSASARMMSSNNLKQIGLALHSHHDANGHLPAPFVESPFAPPGQPVRESELSSRLSLASRSCRMSRRIESIGRWTCASRGTASRTARSRRRSSCRTRTRKREPTRPPATAPSTAPVRPSRSPAAWAWRA